MGRLFGTDGARGVANSELTCELAMQIGRAAAMVLTQHNNKRPKVLIGMDTRASSQMLESAISAGLCSVGADVMLLGEIPTPAVAYLVRKYEYDAAVMISASHNPCEYNGIKIFQGNGYKLPDALEEEIESIILDKTQVPPIKVGGEVGRIIRSRTSIIDYTSYLKHVAQDELAEYGFADFSGLKIAVDCSNGAASVTAPRIFMKLCDDCFFMACHPNGTNINANCGSTHLEVLQDFVVRNNCDVGLAFDGDADRFLAVDEKGNVVDGDKLIAIFAKHMKNKGKLKNNAAVVTVMSNMGFFKFCEENDIHCEKTKVGDRYVVEAMRKNGYNLGGEQSGHIILGEHSTTGDGMMAALQVLAVMQRMNKKASEVTSMFTPLPQMLKNVRLESRDKAKEVLEIGAVKDAIVTAEKALGGKGRIVIRTSGTEPLIRVMAEGQDKAEIEALIDTICETISKAA